MTEHPDYAYAEHYEKRENMESLLVPIISENSSYSHKLPYLLYSLRGMYLKNYEKYIYYDKLLSDLSEQIFNNVLVPTQDDFKGIRMVNYLDGNNGLFKYKLIGV